MGTNAGFIGGVSITEASNIILRNLHFPMAGSTAKGDGLNTTRAHHLWIDHCTFGHDGKVLHQTVGNLSHLPMHVIDLIRAALRGDLPAVPKTALATGPTPIATDAGSGFEILRSLPHGHVAAALGTARKVGLEQLLGPACRQAGLGPVRNGPWPLP